METFLGLELGSTSKVIIGLILVLMLIAISAWLIRQFGGGRIANSAGGRGRQQRLAVLDSASVDARRRLVLIRRDNVEHLILIGGPSDVVIEPNIVRAAPASGATRPSARPGGYEAEDDTSIIPQPEPATEPERAPPAPTPAPRPAAASAPHESPRTMPRPAPQRVDPQYADMAQRLEAALRKPAADTEAPRTPPPPPPQRAPEPRTEPRAEPRVFEPRPAPAPRAPAPRAPEPRASEPRAPEPRSAQPAPAQPAPSQAQPAPQPQSAADVFGSLEEEMASLLRPGKKENK